MNDEKIKSRKFILYSIHFHLHTFFKAIEKQIYAVKISPCRKRKTMFLPFFFCIFFSKSFSKHRWGKTIFFCTWLLRISDSYKMIFRVFKGYVDIGKFLLVCVTYQLLLSLILTLYLVISSFRKGINPSLFLLGMDK